MEGSSLRMFLGGVAALLMCTVCMATDHTVGGSTGWQVPDDSSFYEKWATENTFSVGDKLIFDFRTGSHNVIQVEKAGYESCSSTAPIRSFTEGPATVTLEAGIHYFLCGVGTHCNSGQKVTISVSAGTPSPTSPTPNSSPPPPPSNSASPLTFAGTATILLATLVSSYLYV
ncbi:hypothetical protein AMTRI_Chr05g74410 [Amborella trichopoda]|uniref:Phytocyanin domain-containing protein n=1 Tax=Amborella trichopoda TaxID=13333 RepID=W1P731_AMBTC|nr:mavicyanin [Amborella trichopoda]ERN03723.1 hypothetical protein AMTR_s00078p00022070 [Amborella trichopoda]|eukprot:XP_006842048.1 mavicyanin [Amborella trichopoda]